MNKNLNCRDSGDAFHVDLAIDWEGEETENLTHRGSIDEGEIDERGEKEFSWIIEAVEDRIAYTVTDGENSLTRMLISAESATQLADALTKAVARAKAAPATSKIVEVDRILAAISSTRPSTFNEFCAALKRDCPAKEDKSGWRDLFEKLKQAEADGLVYLTRDEGRIETLILSEWGGALIRVKLDDERPLLALFDQH
jgi:hypothetical protein